jgi:hypothetical protein
MQRFYQDRLYPFQNAVMKMFAGADTPFYLTGGTALSRFYLGHRYSDDLDFFVNRSDRFRAQCDLLFARLRKSGWTFEVPVTAEDFARVFVSDNDLQLKIDLVNDVAYHYGELTSTDLFPRIDHWRNILSNKLCAITRMESKDAADIAFLALNYAFAWEEVVAEAHRKDLWVEPIAVSKTLSEFPDAAFGDLKWIDPASEALTIQVIPKLAKDILLGRTNSLYKGGLGYWKE